MRFYRCTTQTLQIMKQWSKSTCFKFSEIPKSNFLQGNKSLSSMCNAIFENILKQLFYLREHKTACCSWCACFFFFSFFPTFSEDPYNGLISETTLNYPDWQYAILVLHILSRDFSGICKLGVGYSGLNHGRKGFYLNWTCDWISFLV